VAPRNALVVAPGPDSAARRCSGRRGAAGVPAGARASARISERAVARRDRRGRQGRKSGQGNGRGAAGMSPTEPFNRLPIPAFEPSGPRRSPRALFSRSAQELAGAGWCRLVPDTGRLLRRAVERARDSQAQTGGAGGRKSRTQYQAPWLPGAEPVWRARPRPELTLRRGLEAGPAGGGRGGPARGGGGHFGPAQSFWGGHFAVRETGPGATLLSQGPFLHGL
jgi:hypothetical protein